MVKTLKIVIDLVEILKVVRKSTLLQIDTSL